MYRVEVRSIVLHLPSQNQLIADDSSKLITHGKKIFQYG